VDAGHYDRLAAIHLGNETLFGAYRGLRRDIAPGAQILGQHALDEIAQVELRKFERNHFRRVHRATISPAV